jgi:hypothetical protein
VQLEFNHGFNPREINGIRRLIEEHWDELWEAWDEYFAEEESQDADEEPEA